ncbi:MAG: hypothetical protein WKF52_07305 [Sphingomicrobium sp.]
MLVIEPNRAYLAVIARRLAEFGFRIATARTAHDGLAELHRVPVDLMLSELRLPATSHQRDRAVADGPRRCGAPPFAVAADRRPVRPQRVDRRLRSRCRRGGAQAVPLRILAARIGREIERSRAMDSLRQDNAALDARVTRRAIELGEMRLRWERSEAERRRLTLAGRDAA